MTGRQIVRARSLQIMGRPLGEIAERMDLSVAELDIALWRACGLSTKSLRSYWGRTQFFTG